MQYYTYAYLREDGTPYYIGKGRNNRAFKKNKGDIRPPKDKSKIIFLKQNLTEEEAFKHEIYMIAVFGRKDLGTGILRNRTNGGEGVSGGIISEENRKKRSEVGKKVSLKHKENKTGLYSLSKEQRREIGLVEAKNKIGMFSLTKEQKREIGLKCKENGIGMFSLTKKQRQENGKKSKLTNQKNGTGIFALTPEQRSELGKKCAEKSNYQKWMCLETGYISNPGGLSCYQKKRGIDTKLRIKLEK